MAINSQKLDVLNALTELLQGIVHDPDTGDEGDWNGFDLSQAVFRGRTVWGPNSPLPMLSMLESPRPDVPDTAGINREARSEDWVVLLQGWIQDDKSNPTDPAYLLVAAVEKRLNQIIATKRTSGNPAYPDLYMLGGKLSRFAFGPTVVRPPTEGISAKAFFYCPLRMGLASVVG